MLDQTWVAFADRGEQFKNKTAEYEFTNSIPKEKCFIKLKDGITPEEQQIVLSGLQGVIASRDVVTL